MSTGYAFGNQQGQRFGPGTVLRRKPKKHKYLTLEEIHSGALSHMMAPPKHADPGDLVGVSIDISGAAPVVVEHTRQGWTPKHVITTEPQWFDIRLPDGREISVEVRLVGADEPLSALEYEPASLWEFADNNDDETD